MASGRKASSSGRRLLYDVMLVACIYCIKKAIVTALAFFSLGICTRMFIVRLGASPAAAY